MSYTAIGSGSITLNAVSAEEQKNLQEALLTRYDRLRTADLAQCGDDMAYQIEREYQELTQAMLKYNDPFWWLTVVFKEAGFTEVERNPNDVALSIELSYYNNYYEDMILELLNTLVPFTAEGFISYRGEKGDLWCHVFAGGEWTERSGRICYDEPRPQFEESKQNLARLIEEIRRQVREDIAAISRLTKGKTLIVIAHRLSTITDSDQIVVVKDGTIQAKGTHEELLKECSLYHTMWTAHMDAKEVKTA